MSDSELHQRIESPDDHDRAAQELALSIEEDIQEIIDEDGYPVEIVARVDEQEQAQLWSTTTASSTLRFIFDIIAVFSTGVALGSLTILERVINNGLLTEDALASPILLRATAGGIVFVLLAQLVAWQRDRVDEWLNPYLIKVVQWTEPQTVEKATPRERRKRSLWMMGSTVLTLGPALAVNSAVYQVLDLEPTLWVLAAGAVNIVLAFYIDAKYVFPWGVEYFDITGPWQFREEVTSDG